MQKRLTRLIALVMVGIMIMMACPTLSLAASPRYGDPDNSGTVDATDALLVLRAAVKKMEPTKEQTVAGDVNGDQKLDASDALLILQYAVDIIDEFPVLQLNPTYRYYKNRDAEYKVDYSDFDEIVTINDVNDAQEIVEKLGGDTPEAPVETAEKTADGLLSYTPISDEAIRLGQTQKYKIAPKKTGTIRLGDTTVSYSMPISATAYDAVPIEYSLVSTSNTPVHLEAVAFEEAERYPNPEVDYYDCNLPGTAAIEVEYLGYVNGYKNVSLRPSLTPYGNGDKQGEAFPSYTTDDLVKSGTVKANADYTWFKWKFTNVGNTILDGEGNSAFRIKPLLYKKGSTGWEYVAQTVLNNHSFLDYVYPEEGGEFWTTFAFLRNDELVYGLEEGEYRIILYGYLRNEQNAYDYARMQVNGDAVTTATFDFTVTANSSVTVPTPVVNQTHGKTVRNKWLGNFEEFMSSYTTVINPGKTETSATKGTLYVQPAPWTDQIVLKVIHGDAAEIKTVRIPLSVETDSIKINLNTDNTNYVIKEDGTRTPMVYTMYSPDDRGGYHQSPYADENIVNDLLNIKEAGVNTLAPAQAWSGNLSGRFDPCMYAMDCQRKLDLKFESHGAYLYRYQSCIDRVRAFDRTTNLGSQKDLFSFSQIDAAQGILARWQLVRYGDIAFFNGATGVIPIALEENYGWMTYNLNNRDGIGNATSDRMHYKWLEQAYEEDIDKLNKAYGTYYEDFMDIKLSKFTQWDGVGYDITDTTFMGWTAASVELDLFRTAQRMNQYKEMLKYTGISNTRVYLRSENAVFLAPGISNTTTNARYRHLYYEQRQSALVPEIIAASGLAYGDSSYCWTPFDPSQVYELTRQAAKAGFHTAKLVSANHMIDLVINDTVGSYDYTQTMSLGQSQKGCCIGRNMSLFTWSKAIYEAGGVPGLMWMDHPCDLYCTSTQYKELQFFNQKIQEMLSTEEGKAWATSVPTEALESPIADIVVGAYSYPEDYIEQSIQNTPRYNTIMDFVSEKNN